MCGITFTLTPCAPHAAKSSSLTELHDSLAASNAFRGPDSRNTYRACININDNLGVDLALTSSVLGLRGSLTEQPMIGQRGVLAWNGQVSLCPIESWARLGIGTSRRSDR